MLTANVGNMFVTSIATTLETGVVPTQYIVIISTVRRQSEVDIQRWIDVGPIVNFCLGVLNRNSNMEPSVVMMENYCLVSGRIFRAFFGYCSLQMD